MLGGKEAKKLKFLCKNNFKQHKTAFINKLQVQLHWEKNVFYMNCKIKKKGNTVYQIGRRKKLNLWNLINDRKWKTVMYEEWMDLVWNWISR